MEGEQKEKKKDFLMVMQLMMCNQNENETDIKKNIWNETKTLQAAQHGQKQTNKKFLPNGISSCYYYYFYARDLSPNYWTSKTTYWKKVMVYSFLLWNPS